MIELSDAFTGTCVLEDIPCSNEDGYTVTELSSNRYKNTDINCDGLISSDDHNVTVDLYDRTEVSILFKNQISVWDNLSHTENIM